MEHKQAERDERDERDLVLAVGALERIRDEVDGSFSGLPASRTTARLIRDIARDALTEIRK